MTGQYNMNADTLIWHTLGLLKKFSYPTSHHRRHNSRWMELVASASDYNLYLSFISGYYQRWSQRSTIVQSCGASSSGPLAVTKVINMHRAAAKQRLMSSTSLFSFVSFNFCLLSLYHRPVNNNTLGNLKLHRLILRYPSNAAITNILSELCCTHYVYSTTSRACHILTMSPKQYMTLF